MSVLPLISRCRYLAKVSSLLCINNKSICHTPVIYRFFSNSDKDKPDQTNLVKDDVPGIIASKYNIFKDEDSPIILDIEEERRKISDVGEASKKAPAWNLDGINLKRGVNGVFEIEEIVDLLKREGAEDMFVAKVPAEYRYVDYMIVVTGRSRRHMSAMIEFIRYVFKHKKLDNDLIPIVEGANSEDWLAIDLGNIALHIFSRSARNVYDLDSLWSVGKDFDEKYNQPDDTIVEMLKNHSVYLGDLIPNDNANT